MDEALELETRILAELQDSAEAVEGRTAFVEKRCAQFGGRQPG